MNCATERYLQFYAPGGTFYRGSRERHRPHRGGVPGRASVHQPPRAGRARENLERDAGLQPTYERR
eukprot:1157610-Prorocentrum_minimum.AAC.2